MVAGGPSEASDHWKRERPNFTTAAAVAEGIHAAWYLVRDTCRRRENGAVLDSGGRSLRSDHRLPYETPSGVA